MNDWKLKRKKDILKEVIELIIDIEKELKYWKGRTIELEEEIKEMEKN